MGLFPRKQRIVKVDEVHVDTVQLEQEEVLTRLDKCETELKQIKEDLSIIKENVTNGV